MVSMSDDVYKLKFSINKSKTRGSDSFSGMSDEKTGPEITSLSHKSALNANSENFSAIFSSIPSSKSTSRLMQQIISKSQPDELDKIVQFLLPNISDLMTDIYGNYICQTLFHNCSAGHRLKILLSLRPNLCKIAYHSRGTHSLQILIAMSSLREEEEIYQAEFQGQIIKMSVDINASHVVQRLIVTVKNKYFINREFKGHVVRVATDKLGVCVIKKCCNDPQIMMEVIEHSLMLMQHPYGNYAVQTVLDIWKEEASLDFVSVIEGKVSQLCLQKFSSNVVEKALQIEPIRERIIAELLNSEKISELVPSQYGCYVLRTVSMTCDKKYSKEILQKMKQSTSEIYIAKLIPIWEEIIQNLQHKI